MSTEYEEKDAATTAQYRQLGQGIKILHDDKYAEVEYALLFERDSSANTS